MVPLPPDLVNVLTPVAKEADRISPVSRNSMWSKVSLVVSAPINNLPFSSNLATSVASVPSVLLLVPKAMYVLGACSWCPATINAFVPDDEVSLLTNQCCL